MQDSSPCWYVAISDFATILQRNLVMARLVNRFIVFINDDDHCSVFYSNIGVYNLEPYVVGKDH